MTDNPKAPTDVTTSDDPALKEVLGATQSEREQWLSAIYENLTSLQDKAAWVEDEYRKPAPLPTHVILNFSRDVDD